MGRRRDVRGEARASRRVEADPPRGEEGAQVGGEVAGGAVVGADDQRRAVGQPAVVLEQGREQQRTQGRRGTDADSRLTRPRFAGSGDERVEALVLGGDVDQGTEAHGTKTARIDGSGRCFRF